MAAISARTDMKLRFESSIHGYDLKGPSPEAGDVAELEQEQKAAVVRAKERALARIKERHGGAEQ